MDAKELETRMLAASATANDLHGPFSRTRDWELAYASALVGEAEKDAAAWRNLLTRSCGVETFVVGRVACNPKSVTSVMKWPDQYAETFSYNHVRQATFRYVESEDQRTLRDALLATVVENGTPQKS